MNRDAAIEAAVKAIEALRFTATAEDFATAAIDAAAPHLVAEPVGYVVVNNAGSPLEFFITQAAAEAYAARLNSPDWRARTDSYRVVALTPIEDQP